MQSQQLPQTTTPTLPPQSGSSLSQYSAADIERFKARYMPIAQPKAVRGAGMSDRTMQTLIIGVCSAIAFPSTAFIIAGALPSASNERVIHHQMALIQEQNEQLQKPRKICVLAYCPPDREETSPPETQNPIQQVRDRPIEGERRTFTVEGQPVLAEYKGGQWIRVASTEGVE